MRNGRRSSTAVEYLRPAEQRPNLKVETNALAERILFPTEESFASSSTRKAKSRFRQRQTAKSSSAAARSIRRSCCNSQASGRGALLQSTASRSCTMRPEVGEGLQDHFYCRTFWRCNKPITLNDDMLSLWRKAKIGLDYALVPARAAHRRAPATRAAFVRTRPELKRPDAQLYYINFSTAKRGGTLHPWSGFTHLGVAAAGGVARLGAHQVGRSARGAGDPLQLPRHRERPARDGGGPRRSRAASPPPRR